MLYKYIILAILLLGTIIGLWIAGPIPQDPSYHEFADQRTIWGIPNFWNVASNLPMFFIGLWGIYSSSIHWSHRPDWSTRWIPILLCLGIFFACFGSSYYHWSPNNYTLMWDRLPMTFMFMPLLALLIYDFLGPKMGMASFLILVPLGIFSVIYWHFSELAGHGDLRFYAFVQFFPMLIVPVMIWLFYKKVGYINYILLILGWYVLAKLAEYYDHLLYELTGFWSGHTIKHLLASVSLFYIVKLIICWEEKWISSKKTSEFLSN